MRSGYYSGAKDCDAPEYKAWRAKVYRRDGYTCRLCGAKGVTLNAHHIKRWKDRPDLRLEVRNGITLCVDCHIRVTGEESLWENDFYMLTWRDRVTDKMIRDYPLALEENIRKRDRIFNRKGKENKVMGNKIIQLETQTKPTSADAIDDTIKAVSKTLPGNTNIYETANDAGIINFGKKVLKQYVMVPLKDIKFNKEYQRGLKEKHINNLSEDMKVNGFYGSKVVELNELMEAIDGEQRVEAANRVDDITEIPCEISTFPNKELEAAYYSYTNSTQKSLESRDIFKGLKCSGSLYSKMIYALHEDEASPFYGRIKGLIGTDIKTETKYSITVSRACQMINTIIFNYNMNWRKSDIIKLENFAKQHTIPEVLKKLELFAAFLYGAFKSKNESNIFHDKAFRALCSFWYHLNRLGKVRIPSQVTALITKFDGYEVPKHALGLKNQKHIVLLFETEYNSGRHSEATKINIYGI